MAASYLEASLDRFGPEVLRDDTIEICINPDGQVWGEFQGDHFMRGLGSPLSQTEIKDLANGLLVRTVTDKGVLWDSSERAYNVTVPDGERAKIVAALQANNLPVTEYQILRQYTKKLETKK